MNPESFRKKITLPKIKLHQNTNKSQIINPLGNDKIKMIQKIKVNKNIINFNIQTNPFLSSIKPYRIIRKLESKPIYQLRKNAIINTRNKLKNKKSRNVPLLRKVTNVSNVIQTIDLSERMNSGLNSLGQSARTNKTRNIQKYLPNKYFNLLNKSKSLKDSTWLNRNNQTKYYDRMDLFDSIDIFSFKDKLQKQKTKCILKKIIVKKKNDIENNGQKDETTQDNISYFNNINKLIEKRTIDNTSNDLLNSHIKKNRIINNKKKESLMDTILGFIKSNGRFNDKINSDYRKNLLYYYKVN